MGIKGSDKERQIKSISVSRSSNFVYHKHGARIMLDTDKLIKDGYKPKPFDEFGHAINLGKKSIDTSKHRHYKHLKSVFHNLDKDLIDHIIGDDEEYEERIYKDIKNLGKYIIFIDFMDMYIYKRHKEDLIGYIEKYPHIKVRIINKMKAKSGSENITMASDKGKVVLDIGTILKMRTDKPKKIADL